MKNGLIRNAVLMIVLATLSQFVPPEYIYLKDVFITGFILSNIVSLFENLRLMGITIPNKVDEALNGFKNEKDGDDKHE